MSSLKRPFAGRACCDDNPPHWDYLPLASGGLAYQNRPPFLSEDEWGAVVLIEGGKLWDHLLTPEGLPRAGQDRAQQAEARAIEVITRADTVRSDGHGRALILWCPECRTAAEEFGENLSATFTEMVPVIRGIAMAISFVPVLGTAVSFLLNASVNLAQGASVDSAFLDAMGAALPGQPVSGAAFNVARSLVSGARIDQAAIDGLPVPEQVRDVISVASNIAVAIARGEPIANSTLDAIYEKLPPEGQGAMGTARRIAAGENLGTIAVTEAIRAAGHAAAVKGSEAVNQYVAEAGFQAAIDTLTPDLQAAVKSGILAGDLERQQYIGDFVNTEQNVNVNDDLVTKGHGIIGKGASWRGRLLSTLRKEKTLTMTRLAFDALSGRMVPRIEVYDIDNNWRRGFDAAIGAAEGKSEDDPAQQKVRASLVLIQAQRGFDAGQAIQFERSNIAAGRPATIEVNEVTTADRDWASQGRRIQDGNRRLKTARSVGVMTQPTQGDRDEWARGFDIGTAVSEGKSLAGPGQDQVRYSQLHTSAATQGFDAARKLQYRLTLEKDHTMTLSLGRVITAEQQAQNARYAASGRLIASTNPPVAEARALSADPGYQRGFDIGTAMAIGQSLNGPGKDAVRALLGPQRDPNGTQQTQAGFDTALQLQFGLTKGGIVLSTHPGVAAGQLVASGMIGTGTSADQRVNAAKQLVTTGATKAGAVNVIDAHKKGFFARILDFFGL